MTKRGILGGLFLRWLFYCLSKRESLHGQSASVTFRNKDG
jgi:hypothetical protein